MKRWYRLLLVIVCTSCATPSNQRVSCQGIVAGVAAPQTLQWLGETYEAKYSACDDTQAIVEYYRSDEGPKSWKQMLALRLNTTGPSSEQQVVNLHKMILAQGNRAVASYTRTNADGHGIDFILTAHGYQELNVFRYVDRTNAGGTISFQYARIIPHPSLSEQPKPAEYLKSLRWKAIEPMWAVPVPVIKMVPVEANVQTNHVTK
jgi:hypothetical protein